MAEGIAPLAYWLMPNFPRANGSAPIEPIRPDTCRRCTFQSCNAESGDHLHGLRLRDEMKLEWLCIRVGARQQRRPIQLAIVVGANEVQRALIAERAPLDVDAHFLRRTASFALPVLHAAGLLNVGGVAARAKHNANARPLIQVDALNLNKKKIKISTTPIVLGMCVPGGHRLPKCLSYHSKWPRHRCGCGRACAESLAAFRPRLGR